MIDANDPTDLVGAAVLGDGDSKIGTVGQVYLDETTAQPTWVTVKTGLFGTSESFAPLSGANWDGRSLRLPLDRDFVKDAPRIADDGELSPDEEDALYAYYGGGHAQVSSGRDTTSGDATVGYDTSGPTTDAMTRSEERLHVGTERVEAGRARLRKHVVTEQQTVTVPVSHQEATLHREPITDANIGDALAGPAISEEEHEVVLTGERVVVDKEAVPVERVRLDTETVTEQRQVSESVRKENIELDDPDHLTGR
ncbi:MAG TPA: PRC and DUF2382 domain-containing protein [Naasia sp.]